MWWRHKFAKNRVEGFGCYSGYTSAFGVGGSGRSGALYLLEKSSPTRVEELFTVAHGYEGDGERMQSLEIDVLVW